jgi:hypothetical protein
VQAYVNRSLLLAVSEGRSDLIRHKEKTKDGERLGQ